MRFELRPAVYELLGLLRITVWAPESRTTRAVGVAVLLLLPLFALLAVLANQPSRGGPADAEYAGSWERGWNVERYPD